MTKLPQAVILRQFWFGRERGPVDKAAQRKADLVKPVPLSEVGHIEQFWVELGQPAADAAVAPGAYDQRDCAPRRSR